MAVDLKQRIESIKTRAGALVARLEQERRGRIEAEKRVTELTDEVTTLRGEVDRLERQLEFLRTSGLGDASREDIERRRAVISGLVRDIDKCIANLQTP